MSRRFLSTAALGLFRSLAMTGVGLEPQLTPRTDRHVRGRKCWVHLWAARPSRVESSRRAEIGTFSILYVAALVMTALSRLWFQELDFSRLRWSDRGLCLRSWWCVSRMYLCSPAALEGGS